MLYRVDQTRKNLRYAVLGLIAALALCFAASCGFNGLGIAAAADDGTIALEQETAEFSPPDGSAESAKDFIKWIDVNADGKILSSVLSLCKDYRKKGVEPDFCEVLAYLATKNGNHFSLKTDEANLKKLRAHLDEGGAVSDIYGNNRYYKYYVEGFHAVYDGLVGSFRPGGGDAAEYGIKSYFPVANGFWFSHTDDFGNSRGYGYKRRHLGHDISGSVGAPIVAMEAGYVAEIGWNQYGGWRVGIRSHDQKRYYYYAHLRKDRPYAAGLKQGDTVETGQVIGYLGQTGYSRTENVNLKFGKPHLHVGLQIIFDESQVKGAKEIWVDLYGISCFLSGERAVVARGENKEWVSKSVKR